jgi:hypothetical protein
MRRPLDPALTADMDESWDYDDVHNNWEKENFFCPLCWEYHTMLKRRGEMFCPKQHREAGGLPKIIINRIVWHFDNITEIMQQEPKKYQLRVKSWLPTMTMNREIEMAKEGNQQVQQNAVQEVSSLRMRSNWERVQSPSSRHTRGSGSSR